jgi:hypothetical protein
LHAQEHTSFGRCVFSRKAGEFGVITLIVKIYGRVSYEFSPISSTEAVSLGKIACLMIVIADYFVEDFGSNEALILDDRRSVQKSQLLTALW